MAEMNTEQARKHERDAIVACKDCKHFERAFASLYYYQPAQCGRPKNVEYNVVYGRLVIRANVACKRERRRSFWDDVFNTPRCGISAQFFEPKANSGAHLEGQA